MAFLELRNIVKRYGATVAVDDADLDLEAGEVHVLIGANGCGKSTLCKIVAGSVAPDAGEMRLDGRPVAFRSPREAADAGISVFYQELSLIPTMTVAENLFLGREPTRGGLVDGGRRRREADAAFDIFRDVVGVSFSVDRTASEISTDERQITEILKTLGENGRLVIFDEPTASLDKAQVEIFFGIVRRLKAEGRAIVFISHRMDEIFAVGDRVSVMRDGRIVETARINETSPAHVLELMTGETAVAGEAAAPRQAAAANGPVVLRTQALGGERFDAVDLTLRAGEIVGLGGLHGQGQSAFLRSLFGIRPAARGTVELAGKRQRLTSPARAIAAGMAYISGDRSRDGVATIRPILENLSYAALATDRGAGFSPAGMRERLRPILEKLSLKFGRLSDPVRSLSGGNQQKVVIGRWLAAGPSVILFDDPTKGIDVSAKADLYRMLRELASSGAAILFYSSEDAELLENTDRILVFNGGRVVRELTGEARNAVALNEAAYGGKAAA